MGFMPKLTRKLAKKYCRQLWNLERTNNLRVRWPKQLKIRFFQPKSLFPLVSFDQILPKTLRITKTSIKFTTLTLKPRKNQNLLKKKCTNEWKTQLFNKKLDKNTPKSLLGDWYHLLDLRYINFNNKLALYEVKMVTWWIRCGVSLSKIEIKMKRTFIRKHTQYTFKHTPQMSFEVFI